MEQGGEKENNHARTACPSSPHLKVPSGTRAVPGSQTRTNPECTTPRPAELHLGTAPLALGLPRNPNHSPCSPPSCQATAVTSPRHQHTWGKLCQWATKTHQGKATQPWTTWNPLSQHSQGCSEQTGLLRTGQTRGPVRDAGKPEEPLPCSLILGPSRNTTKKYFTVKDFKVQFLKCSACWRGSRMWCSFALHLLHRWIHQLQELTP